MEFDGEAMHLDLDLCQHMKKFAVHLQRYMDGWEAVEQFVGAVTVVFGEAGNGDIKVQFVLDYLSDDLHLALTTICDDKVGEGLFFFHQTGIATMYHFLHRSIVVRPLNGLDVIVLVVTFRGLHFLEDHTGCNGVCTRYIRVVEALDMEGQFRQMKFVLKLLHQTGLLLLRIEFFCLLQAVELILFPVHDRQVEQCLFIAALGNGEGHVFQV